LEFSRLEIVNGLTSKRKINALVSAGKVDGWDDPRLLTLDALARRGFPPKVLFKFIEDCGISRSNGALPFSRLEDTLRLELDATASRRVLVLDPVELVITGSHMADMAVVSNHPKDASWGTREFGLSSNVYVERDDIRLPGRAEKGFKRLDVGACVRLMNVEIVTVTAIDDVDGRITKVYANATPEVKPRATIHALSMAHAMHVEVAAPSIIGPDDTPESCMRSYNAVVEPGAMDTIETFHAIRVGYAVVDCKNRERLILTAGLKKGF
jgi:glutaminyl-tRNA synthetase